jgi:hypothetical protein
MPPKPVKEDKLFGVKNKKGGKMQKMASQLQAQQMHDAKLKMSAKEKQKELDKKAEKEKKDSLEVSFYKNRTCRGLPDAGTVLCKVIDHISHGVRCYNRSLPHSHSALI